MLTVPIERNPNHRNLPFWRVTISDPKGNQLFKDDGDFIGTLKVYWCWDAADRVWLYNSDDGATYYWEFVNEHWTRQRWQARPPTPPDELYPIYAKQKK